MIRIQNLPCVLQSPVHQSLFLSPRKLAVCFADTCRSKSLVTKPYISIRDSQNLPCILQTTVGQISLSIHTKPTFVDTCRSVSIITKHAVRFADNVCQNLYPHKICRKFWRQMSVRVSIHKTCRVFCRQMSVRVSIKQKTRSRASLYSPNLPYVLQTPVDHIQSLSLFTQPAVCFADTS